MSPKDLKFFYNSETRHPLIQDGVFSIPPFSDRYEEFPMPDWQGEIFQNDRPIHLEFCSGNGEWITACALERPEINWIAVERKFMRVRKIWSKMKNLGLKNLFIVYGSAEDFTKYYLPDGVVSAIYINFPDPWPKKKHAKKRLIQPPFVEMMAKISKKGAPCTIVTDDSPYASFVIQKLRCADDYEPAFPEPFYVHKPEAYGSSYFNRLWEGMGKPIYFMQFIKNTNCT